MAADSEITRFVREALGRGIARSEIEAALAAAGWPPAQVRAALAGFAETDFPVPVPRPKPYLSARDAFLYLVMFSALGLTAWHFGHLVFLLIDQLLPDVAGNNVARAYGMRWAVAVLIVAFPLYLILARRTTAELAREPAKRGSRVRKWLTYVTLFVAALFIVGDLVALIYQYLNGELTTRLVLKILTVAVIAGTIFLFYLRSVSGDEPES